ncbi:hypothetical protein BN381_20119 [Candidatus Microthrix parvicella RN1]|uniref:Uncharacterized protein n=1 Tax=Candidatus Neomicrothrix parvicella RN1 TaxID=1229780 RepID=R4YYC5_9ACTN|nr:hypothetical protein BN381_20119 [Candidatus Microthrix parvicella RN1]
MPTTPCGWPTTRPTASRAPCGPATPTRASTSPAGCAPAPTRSTGSPWSGARHSVASRTRASDGSWGPRAWPPTSNPRRSTCPPARSPSWLTDPSRHEFSRFLAARVRINPSLSQAFRILDP